MAGGILGVTPLTAAFRSNMKAPLVFEKDGVSVARTWSERTGKRMVVALK